jgi:hypothetical protein
MIDRLDLMSFKPALGNPRVASANTSAVEQASKAFEKSLLIAYATQILLSLRVKALRDLFRDFAKRLINVHQLE